MSIWANMKKAKRDRWEVEQAKNLKPGMARAATLRNMTLNDVIKLVDDLEAKTSSLAGKLAAIESKKQDTWKVQQNKEGKTSWVKPSYIRYVSEIYADGPGDGRYFDAIIDGVKIHFKEETEELALQLKLRLLDVDRIEDFTIEEQEEMFGGKLPAKDIKN